MAMHRRKIQLVAGTTYSVSLPKDWVLKNSLKEQSEIIISERSDRTLVISPLAAEEKDLREISLNVDEYAGQTDQILLAAYYLGIETINIYSKNELPKDIKKRIRKTLTHMSGAEISYETHHKLTIKILLDRSKIDINQLFYRIALIIELSISNLIGDFDLSEININENEIDRLYHLIVKTISTSLVNSNVLHSSHLNNVSLIPSYFLIAKKLENIGDNINHLCQKLNAQPTGFGKKKEILNFIVERINHSIRHIIGTNDKIFERTPKEKFYEMNSKISKLVDQTEQMYLEDIIRYIEDIECEVLNITFYKRFFKGTYE